MKKTLTITITGNNKANYNQSIKSAKHFKFNLLWSFMKNIYFLLIALFLSDYCYSQVSCPGIPAVIYGGQTYNTILIGNQCWLKENLNVGSMVLGAQNQTNNDIIEK